MKDFSELGQNILTTARNQLYMSLPYLDAALCGLEFRHGSTITGPGWRTGSSGAAF